jgi:glucuronate isomerase
MINTDKYEEYMELVEERIERTADAWDEMADAFFERHGWTKDHMAYDTDRGTKTLWVMTEYEPEVWENTGISAREADSLLCEGWDEAEYQGFLNWMKEMIE